MQIRPTPIMVRLLIAATLAAAGSAPPAAARSWFNTLFDIYNFGAANEMLPYDANHDAQLDMITSAGVIALGQPNGDFVPGTGFSPPSLANNNFSLVDFNGDGLQDAMLTASVSPGAYSPERLYIYRKLAGNGFAAALSYPLSRAVTNLHAGDFDGNGLEDALVLHGYVETPAEFDTMMVYYSTGSGMGMRQDIVLPRAYPRDAAVADFDEDGRSDAIVICRFTSLYSTLAYYMSASGGFSSPVLVDSVQAPLTDDMDVADVDHDGHMDFVAGNFDGTISTFFGNGDGTFRMLPRPGDVSGTLCGPWRLAHVNTDDDLDILTGCYVTDIVSTQLGNGSGYFGEPFTHHFGRRPYGLVAHDFDGDGYVDIAGTASSSGGISVLWGNAAGTYNVVPQFPIPAGITQGIAVDWDGDGVEDLVDINRDPGSLSVLRNRVGSFDAAVTIPLGFRPANLRFVDLDLDGDLDIIAVDGSADVALVLLRDAAGTFPVTSSFAVGNDPSDVAAGDFNGDGIPDLVVSNYTYPTWSSSYLQGIGGGQFQPAVSMTSLGNPSSIATGDFNEDGNLDFITGHPFDRCSLFLGHGDGTFNPHVSIGTTSTQTTTPLQVWDMNNDGHLDLVAKRQHGVGIRYGTGLGTFGSAVIYSMGSFISNIAVRDFDLDGRLDMASACVAADYVTVRFGADLNTLNYYGVDREVIWVTPIALDAGPSVEIAALVSNGPKAVILSHPDAISAVPESGHGPGELPFRLAANPARGLAHFQLTRDLRGPSTATIHDVTGRRVARLDRVGSLAGNSFDWRGLNDSGRPVSPGRYIAVMTDQRDRWSIPFLWFP